MKLSRLIVLLAALLAAQPLAAAPRTYRLNPAESVVGFVWSFGKDRVQGRMPVAEARVQVDFEQLANSKVSVSVDTTRAEAGFLFATQAMRGPRMLDADRHGRITFTSRSVHSEGRGALIEGDLTVRGITRPMAMHASLHRQSGAAQGDLDHLQILLTGTLRRSDFGATGWSDMVADEVELRILAAIDAAP